MVAADRHAARAVHTGRDRITGMQRAFQQRAGVHKVAFGRLFDSLDPELGVLCRQAAGVGHLAAHLGIERRMIEHDQHALAALAVVGGNGVEDLLPVRDRHNGRFPPESVS